MKIPQASWFYVSRLYLLVFTLLSVCCANSKFAAEDVSSRLLSGDWVVTHQNFTVVSIPPLCKSIQKGTVFNFYEKELKVYNNSSQPPCDVFGYRLSGNKITFQKDDMLWLCRYELNQEKLKLSSDVFFRPVSDNISPGTLLQTDTVVVTLIKRL